MSKPLVSVICLCYNHRQFLLEALESVLNQTYKELQIIIVDDASTDGSGELIQGALANRSDVKILLLPENVGNCRAFNLGLRLATGDFVIDFSTDDVMLPERVAEQVKFFMSQQDRVGVIFTDAWYIDAGGKVVREHYPYLLRKKLIDRIPSGDIFRGLLTTYFICSPTMMVRKTVFEELQGYDEELAYEDFDFWVRASRKYHFAFLNAKLTKVRKSSGSMSTGWYEQGDRQLHSTYLVCKKAFALCLDEDDRDALRWRVLYEFKQASFSSNKDEAGLFADLLKKLGVPPSFYLIKVLSRLPLPWFFLRKKYYKFFYK